jgi:small subunit ribosomal protein S24e
VITPESRLFYSTDRFVLVFADTYCFEILLAVSAASIGNMDIEIIEEVDNPMLHRSDVRFRVIHDEATPSRLSVRDSLAATMNKDADEVVIHELDTKYGMRKTIAYAKVYQSAQRARDVEQSYMLERNKIGVDEEGDTEAEAEEA